MAEISPFEYDFPPAFPTKQEASDWLLNYRSTGLIRPEDVADIRQLDDGRFHIVVKKPLPGFPGR
jgi:hypothetical protein